MSTTSTLCAITLSAFGLTAAAQADLINIAGSSGIEGLGAYTGTVNYTPISANAATVVVMLTNTSPVGNGGFLTGLVMLHGDNFPGMSFTLTGTTDADFTDCGPAESASPFGSYRGGAALGGDWSGGGSPVPGIAIGQSVTLTFSLTGTGSGLLNASSLVGLHSGHQDMVVRFRGFENGGSDKVPGSLVPTPGAAAMLGLGGLLAARRRR